LLAPHCASRGQIHISGHLPDPAHYGCFHRLVIVDEQVQGDGDIDDQVLVAFPKELSGLSQGVAFCCHEIFFLGNRRTPDR
jgi:hypothetical protein